MFRLRAKTTSVCRRIAALVKGESKQTDARLVDASVLAKAIYQREQSGEATTLRELHKITELTQQRALKAADELQRAGALKIEGDMLDALGANVALSPEMAASLGKIKKDKAA